MRATLPIVLTATTLACSSPVGFAVGAEVPAAFDPTAEPGLVWVLQSEDHLRCETDARAIRHVQRRRGIDLSVVVVGGDRQWVRSFLTRERLRADLVGLSPATFRRRAGVKPASELYVVAGGRVAARFPTGREILMPEQLDGVLTAVAAEQPRAVVQ